MNVNGCATYTQPTYEQMFMYAGGKYIYIYVCVCLCWCGYMYIQSNWVIEKMKQMWQIGCSKQKYHHIAYTSILHNELLRKSSVMCVIIQASATIVNLWLWVWVWVYECMRLFTLFGFNEFQIVSFDVNHLPYTQLFSTLRLWVWELSFSWLQLSYHIILRMHLMISFSLIIKLILARARTHAYFILLLICPQFVQLRFVTVLILFHSTRVRTSRHSCHQ